MTEAGVDLIGDGRQTMNPTGAAAAASAVGVALPPGSTAEEQLADRFFGLAFHLALVRTREWETARDLAQDTMLAVVRALREGRLLDAENLAGYVCGTARNLIRSYWRVRTRRPDGDALPEDLAGGDFEAEVEQSERLNLLHRAIARLPAPDREVMLLTLDDGLKSAEISRHLGLSPEVLRQRKSRALKRVREMLGPPGRPSAGYERPLPHGSSLGP